MLVELFLLVTLQSVVLLMKKKVAFEIKKLDNMITRLICDDLKKENIKNISHTQVNIIKYLYVNKDKKIYQSDIEKEVPARRSTISGILKTMEKNGLITRTDSKIDTRKKEVNLTLESIKRYKEMEDRLNSFEKNLTLGISSYELNIFYKVIDKINLNIEKKGNKHD